MPEPVEQLGGAVKHEDTIGINWQFKANLSELPPEGITLDAPGPVPLPGDWKLQLKNVSDNSDELCLFFKHGFLPVGAFGTSVTVKLRFDLVKGADKRRIAEDVWDGAPEPLLAPDDTRSYGSYSLFASRSKSAASGQWRTSEQNRVQQYTCSFVIVRNLQLDTAHSHYTPTADLTKAQRLAGRSQLASAPMPRVRSAPADHVTCARTGTLHTRHADICLRFRRPGNTYLELWTTSGLLATASEYYKTLLASGCAETVPSRSKRQRGTAPTPVKHEVSGKGGPAKPAIDWHDSDDETDDLLVERDWRGCKTATRDLTDLEYQQIDVRETAYSTMSTVLLYLMTGHIEFALLNSLLNTLSHDETASRRALFDDHISEHSTLPPPVSPKSVYRLAHLLQRDELQRLALDALSTSLTAEGAASELFGPVSIAYTDVRQTILDYVVKNWAQVQATESWKEWRGKVAADEVPGGAAILADLLGALYESKS